MSDGVYHSLVGKKEAVETMQSSTDGNWLKMMAANDKVELGLCVLTLERTSKTGCWVKKKVS